LVFEVNGGKTTVKGFPVGVPTLHKVHTSVRNRSQVKHGGEALRREVLTGTV
jgi:hypothetical protein